VNENVKKNCFRAYLDHWLSGRAACCSSRHGLVPCLNSRYLMMIQLMSSVSLCTTHVHLPNASANRTCSQTLVKVP